MTLSLRSDALEPTRPELASLSAGDRVRRYLPVYGLPIIGLLLIVLFSAIFPHTFPTLANVSAMIDNKAIIGAAVSRGAGPDGGRQDRSDDRLRHRALAHPRHQPAAQLQYSLGSRGRHRARLRRRARTDQRAPRRIRADRRLRRDARHRDGHLCDRALVYRRAAGRRRASRWFRRHRRHPHRRAADQHALRARPCPCVSGSPSSISRLGASSMRSAPTRARLRSTASRCAAM